MDKNKFIVEVIKDDELIAVVYCEATNEKGVFKLLKKDYKNCSFNIKEFKQANKEVLYKK